jgi:(1->4)-alpha-D-glucan 1-alpha-D-glucosylmutase
MRIPAASYRIQFTPSFGFEDATQVIPYLAALGVSDLYASPIFKAKKGSKHGYDIVDPNRLNEEFGTEGAFGDLITVLKENDLGWIQDIVPNHMAFDGENEMLMDVMENGENSEYIEFFDIEWVQPYEILRGRLLAPFLGSLYGESLEDGEIILQYESNGFSFKYYDIKFPLKIESYTNVMTSKLSGLRERLGEEHEDFIKFLGILYSIKNLPTSREETAARYNQIRFIKKMLWELYSGNQEIHLFIDENVDMFNGGFDDEDRYHLLETLLSEQFFRLAFWKVATEEINYRRFFNINGLISLRMEKEPVFDHSHVLIVDLLERDMINALRVDHIDGLYDPAGYLTRLREKAGDVYIIVEKVLGFSESLPESWPVQGTTGYDFMNCLNGIFCERENGRKFSKIYHSFTGLKMSHEAVLYEKKKLIIEKDMTGDVDNLAHLLKKISSKDRYGSDITLYGLKKAIVEILACFPVYRTYIASEAYTDTDHDYISTAVEKARSLNPGLLYELNFIERFLLLEFGEYLSNEEREDWIRFVMRFQQFSGPLMAKGYEDTTLYVYNRLLSLNEVGGDQGRFGFSLDEFHEFIAKRALRWPQAMNATSTHDSKRGEDVRARINVLSEIPEEWEQYLKLWFRMNKKAKRKSTIPDRNDEYFLYQTILGAYPYNENGRSFFVERVKEYMIKAVREAKVHTAWLKPDTEYEEGILAFIDNIFNTSHSGQFLHSFMQFRKKVSHYGIFNSLSQMILKIASPGVPDFYQGTELWDLNLVDPDNRRPVDYGKRATVLREIQEREHDIGHLIHDLLASKEDGRIKFFLTHRGLLARMKHSELFRYGSYLPIETTGTFKDHIIAFSRTYKNSHALVIVPRFLTRLVPESEDPLGEAVWGDTSVHIPQGFPSSWQNEITGRDMSIINSLSIGNALKSFPCALLVSTE